MGIEVRNLGVSYGNHCVFKDINLDINEALEMERVFDSKLYKVAMSVSI